jgi:hypothetical protein
VYIVVEKYGRVISIIYATDVEKYFAGIVEGKALHALNATMVGYKKMK